MRKKLIFDFCIIKNSLNSDNGIIFVAKSGDNFLDKSLIEKKEYKDIKKVIEKFGYIETSQLQFEPLSELSTQLSSKKMKTFLESYGLNYSKELEDGIKEFSNLKNEDENLSLTKKTVDKLFNFKYKEPDISGKVTLYFYLFLEFGFNQYDKPVIYLNGDFNNSEDHDTRNYIKIVESDFERVIDPNKLNSIVLSSCKKQKDFLREIGILYSGFFKYQRNFEKMDSMVIQEKKYPYKLAEVRKFLDLNQSIVIETNRVGYDTLINLSSKIRTESVVELRQLIPITDIEHEVKELTIFLNKRIKELSEIEEFEKAAKIKKDVDFINGQIIYLKKINRAQITTKEYFKIFSIP